MLVQSSYRNDAIYELRNKRKKIILFDCVFYHIHLWDGIFNVKNIMPLVLYIQKYPHKVPKVV